MKNVSTSCSIPSLVGTKESVDDDTMFPRGLFDRHTGWASRVGVKASSIFQGETLSGRWMGEVSSHRTCKRTQGLACEGL